MRILFSLLDAGIGGGQRVALEVARRLITEGDMVGLLVPAEGPAADDFRELGSEVYRADLQTLRRTKGVERAVNIVRDYDILYSHTSVSGEILGARVAARAGIAHVVHRHNEPRFSPRMVTRLIQRALYLQALRSTPFIAVAPHVHAALQRLGIKSEGIAVIPNGLDVDSVRERIAHDGLGASLLRVGVLGRLDPVQKGQDVFIDAVRRVGKQGVSFVIGGASGPFHEHEAAVRRAAADSGVTLEDPGSRGLEFLASLDIVVIPSRYEGSPLTLFEAMALGKPIIATSVPGIAEVLGPTGAGDLVPPNDPIALATAITSLLIDPKRRQALGRTALDVVRRQHDLGRVLDRIVAVLRSSTRAT